MLKATSQSAQKIIPQFGMHSNTKSAIGPDRLTRSSHFLSADWDTTLRKVRLLWQGKAGWGDELSRHQLTMLWLYLR